MIHLRLTSIQIFVDELFKLRLNNQMQSITETDFNLELLYMWPVYPFRCRLRSFDIVGTWLKKRLVNVICLPFLLICMRCDFFVMKPKRVTCCVSRSIIYYYGPNLKRMLRYRSGSYFSRNKNAKGKLTHITHMHNVKTL